MTQINRGRKEAETVRNYHMSTVNNVMKHGYTTTNYCM